MSTRTPVGSSKSRARSPTQNSPGAAPSGVILTFCACDSDVTKRAALKKTTKSNHRLFIDSSCNRHKDRLGCESLSWRKNLSLLLLRAEVLVAAAAGLTERFHLSSERAVVFRLGGVGDITGRFLHLRRVLAELVPLLPNGGQGARLIRSAALREEIVHLVHVVADVLGLGLDRRVILGLERALDGLGGGAVFLHELLPLFDRVLLRERVRREQNDGQREKHRLKQTLMHHHPLLSGCWG